MHFRITLVIIAFLWVTKSTGQNYFGIGSSNYAGAHSIYYNPANIADSRLWFDYSLLSASVDFSNNIFKTKGNIFDVASNSTLTNDLEILGNALDLGSTVGGDIYTGAMNRLFSDISFKKHPELYFAGEVRGPSVMFDIGHKTGIALSTRLRYVFNGIDQMEDGQTLANLHEFLSTDVPSEAMIAKRYNIGNFKTALGLYGEVGLSLGRVLVDRKTHFLKGGITLKRTIGFDYLFFRTLRAEMQIANIIPAKTAEEVKGNSPPTLNLRGEMELMVYKNPYIKDGKLNDYINYFFNGLLRSDSKIPSGYGLDLGIVYEYRPDADKYKFGNLAHNYNTQYLNANVDYTRNKYAFKASLSLRDVGYINFNTHPDQQGVKLAFKTLSTFAYTNASDMVLTDVDNVVSNLQNSSKSNAQNILNITLDSTYQKNVRYRLPMSVVGQLDYRLTERIFVASTLVLNMLPKYSYANRIQNVLNVTPRYESPYFDFGMPITYHFGTQYLGLGLGFRVSVFHFGFDNISWLMTDFSHLNVYAGLRFYITKGQPFLRFFSSSISQKNIQYHETVSESRWAASNAHRPFMYQSSISSGKRQNTPISHLGNGVNTPLWRNTQSGKALWNTHTDLQTTSFLRRSFNPSMHYKPTLLPERKITFNPTQKSSVQLFQYGQSPTFHKNIYQSNRPLDNISSLYVQKFKPTQQNKVMQKDHAMNTSFLQSFKRKDVPQRLDTKPAQRFKPTAQGRVQNANIAPYKRQDMNASTMGSTSATTMSYDFKKPQQALRKMNASQTLVGDKPTKNKAKVNTSDAVNTKGKYQKVDQSNKFLNSKGYKN